MTFVYFGSISLSTLGGFLYVDNFGNKSVKPFNEFTPKTSFINSNLSCKISIIFINPSGKLDKFYKHNFEFSLIS